MLKQLTMNKNQVFFSAMSLLAAGILLPFSVGEAQTIVPSGGNVYTYINSGNYNLVLDGGAIWNGNYNPGASVSSVTINGDNNILTVTSAAEMFDFDGVPTMFTLNLLNTNVQSSVSRSNALFYLRTTANQTAILNLQGSTFSGFFGVSGYRGNIFGNADSNAGLMIINSGTGASFINNRSAGDASGVLGVNNSSTFQFNGNTTFERNYAHNYGGAVSVVGEGGLLT